MTYPIEKDVPLQRAHKIKAIYPLDDMSVGDSFLVPGGVQGVVSGALVRRTKTGPKGRRYTTRIVDGGIRVWRVA